MEMNDNLGNWDSERASDLSKVKQLRQREN